MRANGSKRLQTVFFTPDDQEPPVVLVTLRSTLHTPTMYEPDIVTARGPVPKAKDEYKKSLNLPAF